jgi:hypothetical protein
MSNNDGAAVAQYMAVGEELSRAMVEVAHLRDALRKIRDYPGNNPVIYDGDDVIDMKEIARAALGEKE